MDWALLAVAALLTAALTLWTIRRSRRAITSWFDRAVLRTAHQFRVRLKRYRLVSKRTIREQLLQDPRVLAAVREYSEEHGVTELDARVRVERYIDEIVPYFNAIYF